MAGVARFPHERGRRIFAALAAAAAIYALATCWSVEEKNRMLCWGPTFVVLGMALLSPLLWRASGGTRFAAFGYVGMPVGMALIAPFAGLPPGIGPYAITATAFALTAWI